MLTELAELDQRIAARAAELETAAGGDRAKYLRLLRADPALDELKLEHGICYWLLPAGLRADQCEYIDEAYLTRRGLDDASLKARAAKAAPKPRRFPPQLRP
jgi:hypothetical protein